MKLNECECIRVLDVHTAETAWGKTLWTQSIVTELHQCERIRVLNLGRYNVRNADIRYGKFSLWSVSADEDVCAISFCTG